MYRHGLVGRSASIRIIERLSLADLANGFGEHLATLEQELGRVSAALRDLSRMERHSV